MAINGNQAVHDIDMQALAAKLLSQRGVLHPR
jgi:hypothetical protein